MDNKNRNNNTRSKTNTKSQAPFHLGSPFHPAVSNIATAVPVSSVIGDFVVFIRSITWAVGESKGHKQYSVFVKFF